MAQTITTVQPSELSEFTKMRMVVLNVANGANETSVAIDFAAYGIGTVRWYDFMPRDTHTANAVGWFANLSGTTVTFTWTAADIANVQVMAMGY